MFPRIKTTAGRKRRYGYLVISQSFRDTQGRSTTRDVATLGNVERFSKETISSLVDGLIRLFSLDEYARADDVEILCSLEHGSIVFWRALWERLELGEIVAKEVAGRDRRITIAVARYVEMMVINRCVNPLSKLATSRWMDRTCYAAMKGYAELSREVEYFYRSMDYLLNAKEPIERAIYERLQNLFSVNVNLTFYDITSTFFYGDGCDLGRFGLSRDKRPDKLQVVIGVVTSYEGYPLKHFVFAGNTQDQTTVAEVVQQLRREYHIEQTIFVGDRGMISRLNLDRLSSQGYGHIMGVKARQDAMMELVLAEEGLFGEGALRWRELNIADRRLTVKAFLEWKLARVLELTTDQLAHPAWAELHRRLAAHDQEHEAEPLKVSALGEVLAELGVEPGRKRQRLGRVLTTYHGRYHDTVRFVCAQNPHRATQAKEERGTRLRELSTQLTELFTNGAAVDVPKRLAKLFEGRNGFYERFFTWRCEGNSQRPVGYEYNEEALTNEARHDGVFVLTTSDMTLPAQDVVSSYKNLQEVETLFDDLKHFVDIHPIRHWLERRVRAHVLLCVLALLLKRVLEIDCLKSKALIETLETVAASKLVRYRVRMSPRSDQTRTFWKVSTTTAHQAACFAAVGVKNPQSLEPYVW